MLWHVQESQQGNLYSLLKLNLQISLYRYVQLPLYSCSKSYFPLQICIHFFAGIPADFLIRDRATKGLQIVQIPCRCIRRFLCRFLQESQHSCFVRKTFGTIDYLQIFLLHKQSSTKKNLQRSCKSL